MRLPRAAGVLLHPTSLPGPHGSGDLGPEARHFVDWLVQAGQRWWQVLPLGGIGAGHSPYMSHSAFAGNEWLVDLGDLHAHGWLDAADLRPDATLLAERVDYAAMTAFRIERLTRAAARFADHGGPAQRADLRAFENEQATWLADFTLFMALAEACGTLDWCAWPAALRDRDAAALATARAQHADRIAFWTFVQWRFFRQWAALKRYANDRGVGIVGDTPIFVAHASADVWAHQALFELGADGRPRVVAGVPPDYFSPTGQRWGNPLYRWRAHAADGYAWWVRRIRHTLSLVDVVRIDHFRGFAACWEIDADAATAVDGRWVDAPGAALFDAAAQAIGSLPVIAEDLGLITPDVDALRRRLGFPGMRILQFAFDGDAANPYLPHNYEPATVVYPGTHDNDTAAGWWAAAKDAERRYARGYLATDGQDMAWTLIRTALASVADTAIVPMQDVLALPSDCRMNFPGQGEGWWTWRFEWRDVHPWHAARLAEYVRLYGRDPRAARSIAA